MILKQVFLICCLFGLIRQEVNAQVPVPDFSASVTSGCGPLTVYFKDLSTGAPAYWEWDFGNGQISSLQNPGTSYSTPGTYTVTLIVRNASGTNSIRKTNYISVYPYPSVAFSSSLSQGLGCAPVNVQFTDKSTPGEGSINSWLWNFGDGATSSQPNPFHAFTQTGYYTVGLTVSNSQGCKNGISIARYIRVIPGIQINFAWTQTSLSCSPPYTLSFQNQTSGPGNLGYSWNFGSGSNPSTSIQTNPSTTYPSNANYTVSLHAISDLGCSADTQEVVSLSTGNAVITVPDSVCINSPVNFINGSSPPPLSVYWDFGDGTNSVATNPVKTYSAIASYTVKLVNSYSACADTAKKLIKVVNTPVANFTAPKTGTCQAPFTVNFQDISTGGATAWQWDFGDGNTSTLQNPPHTYTSAGTYDVTLTVSNGVNCSGTIIKSKFIQIAPPTATLALSTATGCINNPVSLAANVTSADGVNPLTYVWTAPGANPPNTSTSATPSFSFPTQGYYNVTLSFTTNDGCSYSNTFTNAVLVGNPVAPIIASPANPTTTCGRQPVNFVTGSPPADNLTWNFGDGTTAIGPTVSHSYSDTGNFNVTLTLVNSGCAHSAPLTIRVTPPIANFGYTIPNCANKLSVQFSDSSKLDLTKPATYKWDFGDGNSQIITAPPYLPTSHLYPAYGPYTVTLTVTNGCTDSIKRTITLINLVPSFTNPSRACRNTPVPLTSTSKNSDGSPVTDATYMWKIGANPYVSGGPIFTATFSPNGNYTDSLIVTDLNGCSYPAVNSSVLITSPKPVFTVVNGGGCKNSPVTFIDQTILDPASANIVSWTWYFGDNGSTPVIYTAPAGPNFTHQYTDSGNYTVGMAVTDNFGCTDIVHNNVSITSPHAGFFAKDTVYCPNVPLPFTDTSSGIIKTYSWDFGDGFTSTIASPSHPFAPGTPPYTIKLKIIDQVGCSDSLTRASYINIQKPVPSFTMTDSIGICFPLQTNFFPNGQYYDSLYWNFGDGTTSTLPVTSHYYNSYDTFYVSLVLKGAGGCIDSATQRALVLNPRTVTTFKFSPVSNCDSVRAFFTIVPPPDTRFTLYFGDGQADSSENISLNHLYNLPNSYGPQLLLQDSSGCIVPLGGSAITVLGAVPFFSMDKKAFCDSGTVNFTDFTISNDRPIQETWNFGNGQSSAQTNPSYRYTTPGIFLVTLNVTTSNNCKENYTDTVHIWQTPHPLITVATPYCISSPIPMQGSLVTPDADPVNWSWNFGDGQSSAMQNPSVTYAKPGLYTIDLRTSVAFGCSDSTSYNLTVSPLPSVKGPKVINTPVGIPVAIPFTYSSNVVSYTWTPDSNLSCTTCPNPLANPIFATLYRVTVTDTSNCSFSDSILVNTICNDKNYFVPNTFSPNGDGVNDVFYPRGTNLYNIQSMRIFNRWGQMVFERRDFPANSQSMGWDGNFNGRQAPSDTYIYVMEVVCNNAQVVAIRGDVTLLR